MTAGILFTPFVAGAQSPWAWSDISRNIGQPRNRPVWAVAQARGFWYFTDGIGFENGGHVQRGNGMILADLTRALTRAGLLRVDDIVSDGKTVLFLKNVMGRSPLFEVVSFDGVKFVNRTERLRAWFDADEGIASVSGRDGQWAFVTTKGKVRIFPNFENLRSRPVATSGVEPVVPVGDLPQFAGAISYSIRHASPADGHEDIPVAIVPFDKGWLIAQRRENTTFLSYTTIAGAVDITARVGHIERLQAIAWNGTSVLLAGTQRSDGVTDRIIYLEPDKVTDFSDQARLIPFKTPSRVIAAWNGTSWMILNGKDLLRFDGTHFESLGKTRDYFLTIAGAPDGSFVLGGVVSEKSRDEIPNRLTAKLVRVVESR